MKLIGPIRPVRKPPKPPRKRDQIGLAKESTLGSEPQRPQPTRGGAPRGRFEDSGRWVAGQNEQAAAIRESLKKIYGEMNRYDSFWTTVCDPAFRQELFVYVVIAGLIGGIIVSVLL